MGDKEALQALNSWFGDQTFRVRDMPDDRVKELIELAEIGLRPTRIGRRSSVGDWISKNDGLECELQANNTIRLVVLEGADGNKPGLYQVQRIA